jgi:hypothetical protein
MLLPSIAHSIFIRQTLSQVRSHLLFHGACLSFNSRGIIIVADSGCGKSTLTLALVRNGCKWLSDEVTALRVSDEKLVSYPRCFWIRNGTEDVFNRFGWQYPAHTSLISWNDSKAIHLSQHLQSAPCQVDYLFLLKNPTRNMQNEALYITLDKLDKNLLQGIKHVSEVENIFLPGSCVSAKSEYPVLKIRASFFQQLATLCDAYGVYILNPEKEAVDSGCYEAEPQINRISNTKGMLELIKAFRNTICVF